MAELEAQVLKERAELLEIGRGLRQERDVLTQLETEMNAVEDRESPEFKDCLVRLAFARARIDALEARNNRMMERLEADHGPGGESDE